MYSSRFLNTSINFIVILFSIITTVIIFFEKNSLPEGYGYLYLLPMVYCICHILFISKVMKKFGVSLFLGIYIVVSFFRYVILSALVVISGWYFGRSNYTPLPLFFNKAIFLMIYEVISYNLFILLFHKLLFKNVELQKYKRQPINIQFSKSNFVYTVFILFTCLLLMIRPVALNHFSFVSVGENYTSLDKLDSLTSVIVVFLNVSRLIIYFMIIKFIYRHFNDKNALLSLVLILLITVLNSLIFFGTNRSDFIFNFIVNLLLLVYLYRKIGVVTGLALIGIMPWVISKITQYRNSATITNGVKPLIDLTDNLQIYLGGIYNVAISLDMKAINHNPFLLLVDVFRSAIGPNIFLKNFEIVSTSQLFNYRIYLNGHIAQIIPMIGQSKFYLGTVFSPLLGILFIFIAIYLTKRIVVSERLELIYIFSLFSGRLGFVMAQNGNILINDLTFFLPLFLVVYYFNNKVVIRK